jgi:hypothetical protein
VSDGRQRDVRERFARRFAGHSGRWIERGSGKRGAMVVSWSVERGQCVVRVVDAWRRRGERLELWWRLSPAAHRADQRSAE